MTTTSTRATAAQSRSGDTAEIVFENLMPDLLSYFVRRLDDREDAADALSETLVVLWRKAASLPKNDEEQRKYAFGVARKVLAATRRGKLKHAALGEALREQLARQAEPAQPIDDALIDAIHALAEKDQELLLLITWDGFGVAEAGSIIGLRPAASRARYSRIRSKLREKLSQSDVTGQRSP